jgi:hypothetical protein
MCTLFLLFRSMNMTDLGIAMNQGGLSYRASFVFINVFQILPVLSKEMTQITDAQRSRGLETEGNILTRVKAFAPIIIPVVCNSIMKVQNQAIALTTKGFSSDAQNGLPRAEKSDGGLCADRFERGSDRGQHFVSHFGVITRFCKAVRTSANQKNIKRGQSAKPSSTKPRSGSCRIGALARKTSRVFMQGFCRKAWRFSRD